MVNKRIMCGALATVLMMSAMSVGVYADEGRPMKPVICPKPPTNVTIAPRPDNLVIAPRPTDAVISGNPNDAKIPDPNQVYDSEGPVSMFKDMPVNHWAYKYVEKLVANKTMNGVGDGKFAPNEAYNRGMLITMLWRLSGSPSVNYLMQYEDVNGDEWYAEAARWATSEKIIDLEGTKFEASAIVTREEVAKIIYSYVQKLGQGFRGSWAIRLDYDDIDEMSEGYYEPMCWMVVSKLYNGTSDRTINPKGVFSRAQAAIVISRFMDMMGEKDVDLANYPELVKKAADNPIQMGRDTVNN